MDYTLLLISILGGYTLGSIPFGLLIAKLSGQGDIRNIGSGNIGATNVLRTGRKDLAALTLLFDAGKAGLAAILINSFIGLPYGLISGAAALIGHCFPIWLKFKGGKGVATFFGALLATSWPIGLMSGAVWLLMAFSSRMSSLGALAAAGTSPFIALLFNRIDIAVMAAVMAAMIYVRHKENIVRILKGQESKIGQKTSPKL